MSHCGKVSCKNCVFVMLLFHNIVCIVSLADAFAYAYNVAGVEPLSIVEEVEK